jgi:hypothetical protein
MNRLSLLKQRLAPSAPLIVAAMIVSVLFLLIACAGRDVKSEKTVATTAETHELTGEELYAINCNRCHAERYPIEFQANQWNTLMVHMRVRANLPASQAREILKYLQSVSGK